MAARAQLREARVRRKNQQKKSDPRQIELFDFGEIQAPTSNSQDKHRQQSEGGVVAPTREEGMKVRRKSSKRRKSIVPVTSPLDRLNPSDRRVYCYLRDEFVRQRRESDAGMLTIAVGYALLHQKAQVSAKTLARALKRLEEKGLIVQHFPALGSKLTTKSYQVHILDEILPTEVEDGIDHRASRGVESHIVNGNGHLKMKPNTAAGQKRKRTA